MYNEKDYLERCVAAIYAQEVPVYEVIVVDNNTDDGSVQAVKKQFPKVRVIHEPEQGIVFARNTGFNAAKGDIIVKIDADTILFPDWHTDLLETMGKLDGWTGYVDNTELHPSMQKTTNNLYRFFSYHVNSFVGRTRFLIGSNMALTQHAWKTIEPILIMRNDIWEDIDVSLALKEKNLHAGLSTHIGATISARVANTTIKQMLGRLTGLVRPYWLRRKWLSVPLAAIEAVLAFTLWLLLKPFAFRGQKITHRSRPEQY